MCILVPDSFIESLQSASADKPKKCPMSKSEADFIRELIKSHGTDFVVGFIVKILLGQLFYMYMYIDINGGTFCMNFELNS